MAGRKSLFGPFLSTHSQALIAAGCLLCVSNPAFAETGPSGGAKSSDDSMDSVWSDQGKDKKTPKAASANVNAPKAASSLDEATSTWSSNQAAKSDTSGASDDSATAKLKGKNSKKISAIAPLCTIDSFARSALVLSGAWPHIGPFRMSDEGASQLVDDSHNSLKLKANRQKNITGVDMFITGRPSRDFLSVEMATDFLLEALGSKPGRISDLNTQLEKMKTKVLKQGTGEQNLSAGRYLIAFKPTRASLTISVSSADASAEAIRDHSQNTTDLATMENPDEANNEEIRNRVNAMIHRKSPDPRTADPVASAKSTKKAPPAKTEESEVAEAQSPDDLKDTFQTLLQNWQQIKKAAVKTRDTKGLSKVLAGKALVKQTNGVKWLAEGHKYYDMNPLSVDIIKVTEVTKGSKYIVTARVKEFSKFYEEGQSKPLRASEDSYSVNYTVDKAGDHFVISDSGMVELSSPLNPKLTK